VAAARGRVALVFVTCAAANSGGLSGWMRASTAAQPAASRLHPPLTPPRVPQAAAAARVAGKADVWAAAAKGDASLVGDHIIVDLDCVHSRGWYAAASRPTSFCSNLPPSRADYGFQSICSQFGCLCYI
jgi:hypothetical protein